MSLQHILLGLLREPASGYDLKSYFDHSVRYFWAAELSQIYPTLQRMEKNGFLKSKEEASSKGPKRRVYSVTPAGKKMLREWLLSGPQMGDERYGFVAQFFFMDAAGDWMETHRYVTSLRETLSQRLQTYKKIEREWEQAEPGYPDPDSPAGFHQHMALRGGLHHLSARIKWCDEVLRKVEQRVQADCKDESKPNRKGKKQKRSKA